VHELLQAGLIKKPEKGKDCYDRFRGRIMFPIFDSAGRTVAFSSRILPRKDNPEYKDDVAKYINSPDTPLYNKSHILYGYDKAKHAIRKFDFSVVVEGQTDLLLSHQAGYPNSVAVSGSAMTEAQLKLLDRLSHNVVLAFDADQAGVASSGRTAEIALSMGMNVKVAALPPGVDPADLVQQGAAAWKRVVRESKHIVDFYLDYLAETVRDTRTLRLEVGRRVLPYVALIPNQIDQAHFVASIAGRLGIAEEPVREELKKVSSQADTAHVAQEKIEKKDKPPQFRSLAERRLLGILLMQREREGRDLDVEDFEHKLVQLMGEEEFKKALEAGENDRNQLLFEVESVYENAHVLQADVDEMMQNVKRGQLVQSREELLTELRQAESAQNAKRVASLMKRYTALTKDLEELSL